MSGVVLVTGGFGYLGGRIATAIAHQTDNRVRLASRTKRQPPPWLPNADTAVLDVTHPGSLRAGLEGIHAIVHLAAINENDSLSNPEEALRVNTLGTLHLLQAAIETGVERFIYLSTAHVYGAPLTGRITEESLPRPIHPYAITHRASEDFVLAAHRLRKITGLVVRLSNGFGAPTHAAVDRWTLLVSDLCRQAVQTRRLNLRSSGLQRRDFITLHDVAQAICHLLLLPRQACGDGLFNLGGDNPMTIWGMTQRVAACCHRALGFTPEIARPEPLAGEKADFLHYDISKLKHTAFTLTGDIDDEIVRTLNLCASEWGVRAA